MTASANPPSSAELDWVCGVARRFRRVAAVLTSDAGATEDEWRPEAPNGALLAEDSGTEVCSWLLRTARQAQTLAVRLYNAGQRHRAQALAEVAAEVAEHAASLYHRLEDASVGHTPDPVHLGRHAQLASNNDHRGDPADGESSRAGGLSTPVRQRPAGATPQPTAATPQPTAAPTGLATGGRATGAMTGGAASADCREGALALACAALHLYGHCLLRGGAAKHDALGAFRRAVRVRAHLDALGTATCTGEPRHTTTAAAMAASSASCTRGGLSTAEAPRRLGGAPSMTELVALHSSLRVQLLVAGETAATSVPQLAAADADAGAASSGPAAWQGSADSAVVSILSADASRSLPPPFIATAAIVELQEIGARGARVLLTCHHGSRSAKGAATAKSAVAPLAAAAAVTAAAALDGVSSATAPLDYARILLAKVEVAVHLAPGLFEADSGVAADGIAGGTDEAAIRESTRQALLHALDLVRPLCAPLLPLAIATTAAADAPAATAAPPHAGTLQADVSTLKVDELRQALIARGIDPKGLKKAALVERLRAACADPAPAGGADTDSVQSGTDDDAIGRGPVPAETVQAIEIHARARMLLATAALVQTRSASTAVGAATGEGTAISARATEEAAAMVAATAAAVERVEAASSSETALSATAEAEAALRAWSALFCPVAKTDGEMDDGEWLRDALPDPEGTVASVCACGRLLWMLMRDAAALQSARVADRAARVLGVSADSAACLHASIMGELGLHRPARKRLLAASEDAALTGEPRRLVCFNLGDEIGAAKATEGDVAGRRGGAPRRPPSPSSAAIAAALAAIDLAAATDEDAAEGAADLLASLAGELAKQSCRLNASVARAALARAHLGRGRVGEALGHAHEAAQLALAQPAGFSASAAASAAACDALLILSDGWAHRGSLHEAQRYAASAATLARHSGYPRLWLRVQLCKARLHSEAGRATEAAASLDAAAIAVGAPAPPLPVAPTRPAGKGKGVAAAAKRADAAAASRQPSVASEPVGVDGAAAGSPAASTTVMWLRLCALRAATLLEECRPSASLAVAERARGAHGSALAALATFAAADDAAADGTSDATAALAPELAGLLVRQGAAQRLLGCAPSALAFLDAARALALGGRSGDASAAAASGGGQSVTHAPDLALLAEIELEVGLCHLAGSHSSDAALEEARAALVRAIEIAALPPATLRRACLGLAASCAQVADASAGAWLLAASIGAGVRNEMVALRSGSDGGARLDGRLTHDGASVAAEDEEMAALEQSVGKLAVGHTRDGASRRAMAAASARTANLFDAIDDDDDDDAEMIEAVGGGVVAGGPAAAASGDAPVSGEAWARGLFAGAAWRRHGESLHGSLDSWTPNLKRWLAAPPNGHALVALSVGPDGRGLLVARWRPGAPPAFVHVSEPTCSDPAASATAQAVVSGGASEVHSIGQALSQLMTENHQSSSVTELAADVAVGGDSAAGVANLPACAARPGAEGAPATALPPPATTAVLVSQTGSQPDITLSATQPSAVLGRTQSGVGHIEHAQVSSKHCTVTMDAVRGTLLVSDSSTNGTFVAGRRVGERPTELKDGVELRLLPAREQGPRYRVKLVQQPATAPTATAPTASASAAGGGSASQTPAVRASKVDREVYWNRRRALDTQLGQLSERMQARLLGGAACLLIPPATEPTTRARLDELGTWAAEHALRVVGRARLVNRGLLLAACDALPCLDDAQLSEALDMALEAAGGGRVDADALATLAADIRRRWAAAPAAANATASESASSANQPPRGKKAVKRATAPAGSAPASDAANSARPDSAAGGGGDEDASSRLPLLLLLDEALSHLPWEAVPALRERPVCRLPCAAFIDGCTATASMLSREGVASGGHGGGSGAASRDAFYVFNPGGDLPKTQAAFEREWAKPPWEGVVGHPPLVDALRTALQQRALYVYCGHGDGGAYMPPDELRRLPRCAATLLMGCSSGALKPHGRFAPTGMALAYLHARCPALVANLWDVTDADIDRFCRATLEQCTRGGSLLQAVAQARSACKLRFLTGAAAVCYGVPLDFRAKDV